MKIKKKNLILAVILPLFLSSFGLLYSSGIAGTIMIVLGGLSGYIINKDASLLYIKILFLVLQPFIVLWSVLIAIKRNELIDKNEALPDSMEIKLISNSLIYTTVILFITLVAYALLNVFKIAFDLTIIIYLLELLLTIAIAIWLIRKSLNQPTSLNKD